MSTDRVCGMHVDEREALHRLTYRGESSQCAAFVLIMIALLLQWPTLPTLVMFPILAFMYVRLARREEREARAEFGEAYARYAEHTPAFLPRLGPRGGAAASRREEEGRR